MTKSNNRKKGSQLDRISNGHGGKVRKSSSPKKDVNKDQNVILATRTENSSKMHIEKEKIPVIKELVIIQKPPSWAQITKIDKEKEIQRNFQKEKIKTDDEILFSNLSKGIRELREKRNERNFNEWYNISKDSIEDVVDVANVIIKDGIDLEESNDIVWALYQSAPVNKRGRKLITELDDHFEFREEFDYIYPHSKLSDYCKSKNYFFLSETLPNPDYGSINDKMYGWFNETDDSLIEIIENEEEIDSETEDY